MSAPKLKLSLRQLAAYKPCADRYANIKGSWPKGEQLNAKRAVELGATLDDLVWIASAVARNDKEVERRLRHWMADCAAHVLHIYEKQHPDDSRVRDAIIAARHFADGEIGAAAGDAARDAARDAAGDAARAAAGDAARAAARAAAGDAARDAARAAAWAAARAAAGDAARAAAWDAEENFQLDRLVAWLSDAPPTPLALPKTSQAEAA